MITIKNLTKIYKTKDGNSVSVINDLSLNLPNTGMIFFSGKSGCGKTTLINLISGLDSPSAGDIIVDNKNLQELSGNELDNYRSKNIGFVFQDYNILNELTVGQNIGLAMELIGTNPTKELVDTSLDEVGLSGFANRCSNELSGGQKQRVALARALIKNSAIIIADEPTGNLDSETSYAIFELLKRQSKHKLVLVVSHDKDNADKYADRIITLKDGQIDIDLEINNLNQSVTHNIVTSTNPRH